MICKRCGGHQELQRDDAQWAQYCEGCLDGFFKEPNAFRHIFGYPTYKELLLAAFFAAVIYAVISKNGILAPLFEGGQH